MKSAPLLSAIFLIALAIAPLHADEEKKKSPPAQAAFLFEWIEVDHRQANKLIRKHADEPSAKKLRKQLGKMIDAKKATLVHTAYLHTRQKNRAKTESIDEHIYPTEYDPAEIIQSIKRKTRDYEFIVSPANPTAFDVRNVGTTVEIEPDISDDGKTITVDLASEIVKHLGDRGAGGNSETVPAPLAPIKHPAFYVMKLQSTLKLAVDDFTLAGIFTPPGDTDRRVLLIVHAKVSS